MPFDARDEPFFERRAVQLPSLRRRWPRVLLFVAGSVEFAIIVALILSAGGLAE